MKLFFNLLMNNQKRNRFLYLVSAAITIMLGLFSRMGIVHGVFAQYGGDVFWGLMVFLIWGLIFCTLATWKTAVLSLLFAYLVEFSQLYHSPLLDSMRSTVVGHLLLGYGFLRTDLLCYTAGIIVGVFLDLFFKGKLDRAKKVINDNGRVILK